MPHSHESARLCKVYLLLACGDVNKLVGASHGHPRGSSDGLGPGVTRQAAREYGNGLGLQ